MKQEHTPSEKKTYHSGAAPDISKDIAGVTNSSMNGENPNGEYLDARNARPNDMGGNAGALTKINGEVVIYPKNFPSGSYQCIGAITVDDHQFEVWAEASAAFAPIIRIDGQIVLQSYKFPALVAFPFQMSKNENGLGGEVFITDYNSVPMIFDVQDMIDSSNPSSPAYDPLKYFANFNLNLYTISLRTEMDRPKFIALEALGGGGGLPVGQYAYSYRYSTTGGDKTKFGYNTPLIPVPQGLSPNGPTYPWSKTFGGPPAPKNNTGYGIKLRFRVNNVYNYDFIEIRRLPYNSGAGAGFTPQPLLIASIPIQPGEVSIRDFVDGRDDDLNPTIITDKDDTLNLAEIQKAKAIRYFNRRLTLMNIQYASRNVQNIKMLTDGSGSAGFPIIKNMGIAGHADAYNSAYYRSDMHGERMGWGMLCMDGQGETSFVRELTPTEMLNIYQIPNRRDPLSADTLAYSVTKGFGAARASDVSGNTNYCHEVFELVNDISVGSAVTKNSNAVHNISKYGSKTGPGNASTAGFVPLSPAKDGDPLLDGTTLAINDKVDTGSGYVGYNPRAFAPTYFSQGIAIRGIDISTLPSWVKSFAIVRTPYAGRVVTQGIGMYKVSQAVPGSVPFTFTSLIAKDHSNLWFFSPDMNEGYINASKVQDIVSNPGNYSAQFVSPLGFVTEVYHGMAKNIGRDRGVDMISYANQIYNDGVTNPGIAGFTRYGSWRNTRTTSNPLVGNGGNYLVGITGFSNIGEGRGNYWVLSVNGQVYDHQTVGGTSANGWQFNDMAEWHEPWYMVNIVQDGVQAKVGNIDSFYATDNYQKLRSVIGVANGSQQTLDLVDERCEDCIVNRLDPAKATINVYLTIEDPKTLNKFLWLNIDFKSSADITTILTALMTSGVYFDGVNNIYGVYTSTNTNDRFYSIRFAWTNQSYPSQFFLPPSGYNVTIVYDNRFPLAVYGGETIVGQNVFSPIDRNSGSAGNGNKEFIMIAGMPYRKHHLQNNYMILTQGSGGHNPIQNGNDINLDYIRQWLVMFCAETKSNSPLNWGSYFPNEFYVMRPYTFNGTLSKNFVANGGNVYDQYQTDYPGEENSWGYGGFKFTPNGNSDYTTKLNDRIYVSQPKTGFHEQDLFCTRETWSSKRDVNIQNAPGLRTFPSLNIYDISDNMGCIKYAYDANTPKGSNLYAITNKGVCLAITEKSILTDLNGGQVGYMAATNFITAEWWIKKDIGMWDEMWRSAAEGSVPEGIDKDGNEVRVDVLYWANNESAFQLRNNEVIDIKGKYHSKLFLDGLNNVIAGYGSKVAGGFDRYRKEFYLFISNPGQPSKTYIYGEDTKHWFGYYDFSFDRFVARNYKMFGMRDMTTFELGVGNIINGQPIVFSVDQVCAPILGRSGCEFERMRVNTFPEQFRPDKIEFFDTQMNLLCSIDNSFGPLYLKDYNGWEQWIPRKDASVSPSRDRVQGRGMIFRVTYAGSTDFSIVETHTQYKPLK